MMNIFTGSFHLLLAVEMGSIWPILPKTETQSAMPPRPVLCSHIQSPPACPQLLFPLESQRQNIHVDICCQAIHKSALKTGA